MGRTGPAAGRGARRRALACRALRLKEKDRQRAPGPTSGPQVGRPNLAYLRIFRAGWLNHVATRRCQSLWKCGFRIMPFRLGAMAAAAAAAYRPGSRGKSRVKARHGASRRPARRPREQERGRRVAMGATAAAPHRRRRMAADGGRPPRHSTRSPPGREERPAERKLGP